MKVKLDNKLEAELAYEQAKKTIAEIKEIQKNIEKLIDEIRELPMTMLAKTVEAANVTQ